MKYTNDPNEIEHGYVVERVSLNQLAEQQGFHLPDFPVTDDDPETKICIGCDERCTFSELDLAVWYGTCAATGRNVKTEGLIRNI